MRLIGLEVDSVVDFMCGDSSFVVLVGSGFQVLGACFLGWYSCYVMGYVLGVEWVLGCVLFS